MRVLAFLSPGRWRDWKRGYQKLAVGEEDAEDIELTPTSWNDSGMVRTCVYSGRLRCLPWLIHIILFLLTFWCWIQLARISKRDKVQRMVDEHTWCEF